MVSAATPPIPARASSEMMTASPPPPRPNLGNALVVTIADMVVSDVPGTDICCPSLGSGLAVIMYDPAVKVGGILNFMLPDSSINPSRAKESPYMFVDTGTPLLIEALCKLGADKGRLVVKVAGGAQFLDDTRSLNIGKRNLEVLKRVLEAEQLTIASSDVGGRVTRNVRLNVKTGEVTIQVPSKEPYTV